MPVFDRDCRACPRLAAFLDEVNGRYPDYYCGPVPPFGAPDARFLIVGLAPGMHGANRTGRPFTGDHAGILLYQMLHRHGFSTGSRSESTDDDLRLIGARITNAVKCLPPDNKPVGAEVNTCNAYLAEELRTLPAGSVVMALGGIALFGMLVLVTLWFYRRHQSDTFPCPTVREADLPSVTVQLPIYNERYVVENKDRYLEERYYFDEWDKALRFRGLIKPKKGFGIAYLDWSQQEFGIAAALSGDRLPAMSGP